MLAKIKLTPKQLLKPLLQIVVTAIALYVVFQKIDIAQLTTLIRTAHPLYLLCALLFFNLSKVINAFRLNRMFKAIGIELSTTYSLKLYYLGMFYNLFLPGGVGGDGYKVYILQKNYGIRMLNVFHAVLWDRIGGIFALTVLALALLLPSNFATLYPMLIPWAWGGLLLLYPIAWLVNKLFYKQFLHLFAVTSFDSMLVQVTQTIAAWFILEAMNLPAHHIDYLAIFLLSSVATILPITVGGAGAREITFLYLLNVVELNTNPGVALSLIFFVISAISSLAGILSRIKHEKADVVQ
uniref:Integral membrane protein n=1 Tax=Chlorobium chlorochromatii (strain CaD3) TaxID=340177 RepID=Q3ASZ8_CHLCH